MTYAGFRRATAVRFGIWIACCAASMSLQAASLAYPSFYPADAARGKGMSTQCLACHGAIPLKFGSVPYHAPKLGGQRPSDIFDALLEYKTGQRRSSIMAPIAAALPMQDMRDISAYLAGAQIKPSFAPVPDSWARSKVMNDCAACHGETGLGVMIGYPVIGGQYGDYIVQALRDYKNGERSNPTMAVMASRLSDAQIVELGAYFDYFSDLDYLRAAR